MEEGHMDKTLRSILWILVALVVLSSFSTGWFFVAKERLCNEYANLENLFRASVGRLNRELASSKKQNIELKSKLEVVEKELSVLEAMNMDLKSRYEVLLSERDDLNKELVRVKKGKFFLEKKLKDMESDMFVAGLLRDKVSLEVELKRLKDLLAPKDLEIERLKRDNMNLDVGLSMLKEERNLLEQKVKDSSEVAEILSRDLLREKDKIAENKQAFENTKLENYLLKTKISELEEATREFNRLLAEKDDMQLRISSLEKDLGYKDQEIDKLRLALGREERATGEFRAEAYHSPGEVDLPPIVLQKEYRGPTRLTTPSLERISGSSLKGRIVTINRDHDFVVVDLGRQDGIDAGTRFKVYRDNLLIGSIEVIQTRERIAAADIKDLKEGFSIEIDDIVVK